MTVVPRPAATVMLLRDGTRGLEVLTMVRAAAAPFAPGATVFPGGAVDPADHDPHWADRCVGRDDASASASLGIDDGGLGFWIAAIRECLEEVSLLVAETPDGEAPGAAAVDDARDTDDLPLLLDRHGLVLPTDRMAYVSHWITPEPSPRRYSTRFFAAALPPGQEPTIDDFEAVACHWYRPADALDAFAHREIDLITPTQANLELLGRFATTAEAMDVFLRAEQHGDRERDHRGGVRVPVDATMGAGS